MLRAILGEKIDLVLIWVVEHEPRQQNEEFGVEGQEDDLSGAGAHGQRLEVMLDTGIIVLDILLILGQLRRRHVVACGRVCGCTWKG